MKEIMECIICKESQSKFVGSLSLKEGKVFVRRCSRCGHTFTSHRSVVEHGTASSNSTNTTDEYVERMIEASHEANMDLNYVAKNRFDFIKTALGTDDFKFLEIGSGAGGFGAALIGAGMKVENYVGVELDPYLTNYARGRGLNVVNADFMDDSFGEDSFQVVMFTQVLEHINDPGSFLLKVRSVMKENQRGMVYIEVPNHYSLAGLFSRLTRGFGSRLGSIQWPYHCSSYSKSSLSYLTHSLFPNAKISVFTQTASHHIFGQGGKTSSIRKFYFFLTFFLNMKSLIVGIVMFEPED